MLDTAGCLDHKWIAEFDGQETFPVQLSGLSKGVQSIKVSPGDYFILYQAILDSKVNHT